MMTELTLQNRRFRNALREVLGLAPLQEDQEPNNQVRIYASPKGMFLRGDGKVGGFGSH